MRKKTYLSNKAEILVNSLKLPKDTVFGMPILTITGNREIWTAEEKLLADAGKDGGENNGRHEARCRFGNGKR